MDTERARTRTTAPDVVLDQDPSTGENREKGEAVTLIVSGRRRLSRCPSSAASSGTDAIDELLRRGLTSATENVSTTEEDSTDRRARSCATNPAAGTRVKKRVRRSSRPVEEAGDPGARRRQPARTRWPRTCSPTSRSRRRRSRTTPSKPVASSAPIRPRGRGPARLGDHGVRLDRAPEIDVPPVVGRPEARRERHLDERRVPGVPGRAARRRRPERRRRGGDQPAVAGPQRPRARRSRSPSAGSHPAVVDGDGNIGGRDGNDGGGGRRQQRLTALGGGTCDHGRHDLPWRASRDRWCVLVSEVMLQQTQAAAGRRRLGRVHRRFVDLEAMAAERVPAASSARGAGSGIPAAPVGCGRRRS